VPRHREACPVNIFALCILYSGALKLTTKEDGVSWAGPACWTPTRMPHHLFHGPMKGNQNRAVLPLVGAQHAAPVLTVFNACLYTRGGPVGERVVYLTDEQCQKKELPHSLRRAGPGVVAARPKTGWSLIGNENTSDRRKTIGSYGLVFSPLGH